MIVHQWPQMEELLLHPLQRIDDLEAAVSHKDRRIGEETSEFS